MTLTMRYARHRQEGIHPFEQRALNSRGHGAPRGGTRSATAFRHGAGREAIDRTNG
jgi:hypothetical protein